MFIPDDHIDPRPRARATIARAESLGFVREPTLGGAEGYEEYLVADAEEATRWLRYRDARPQRP